MSEPEGAPDPEERAEQVLRYWLTVLRHEAGMIGGCEPIPSLDAHRPATVDLERPSPGGRYLELTLEDEAVAGFALRERGGLDLPLTAATGPFFEHWLHGRYRREYLKSRSGGGGADPTGPEIVAGFPVVLHRARRRMVLAPLLEIEVPDLAWLDAGDKVWKPPRYSARKKGKVGLAPATLRLRARRPDPEDATLPLRLNMGLLQRALGLEDSALRDLHRAADGEEALDVIIGVTRWLARGPNGDGIVPDLADTTPTQALDALVDATDLWFGPRGGTVRRSAMVYDAAWGVPTGRLQEELAELLRAGAKPTEAAPLGVFLGGVADPGAARPRLTHAGLRQPQPLGTPQRLAAESALTEPLTAVQGPPGTGKTHMILQLAAHVLVESARRGVYDPPPADGASRRKTPRPEALWVSSTNNRAVDQVIEPLGRHTEYGRLPLALRVGSRAVTTSAGTEAERSKGDQERKRKEIGRGTHGRHPRNLTP